VAPTNEQRLVDLEQPSASSPQEESMEPTPGQAAPRSLFFDMKESSSDEKIAPQVPDPTGKSRPPGLREYFAGRNQRRVTVSNPNTDGMSLTIFTFAPGTVLPKHRHDVDYIEFVIEGEVPGRWGLGRGRRRRTAVGAGSTRRSKNSVLDLDRLLWTHSDRCFHLGPKFLAGVLVQHIQEVVIAYLEHFGSRVHAQRIALTEVEIDDNAHQHYLQEIGLA
jgi:hypothetical protein